MHAAGKATKLPKMVGAQAANSAPIVDGKIIENPETLATAIRIGNPAKWDEVLQTKKESGGDIRKYTDDTIIDAYLLLAREEGIFCEPSSATSVAAAIDLIRSGVVPKGSTMTFTLTGNGLKDPDTATERGGGYRHYDRPRAQPAGGGQIHRHPLLTSGKVPPTVKLPVLYRARSARWTGTTFGGPPSNHTPTRPQPGIKPGRAHSA